MRGLTDTHSHLSYLAERGVTFETLDRLFEEGFGFMLDIGTEPGDLAGRIEALSKYPNVRFACGIWPHAEFFSSCSKAAAQIEKEIAAAPEGLVAAIGECGFDRRANPKPSRAERELLELQLDIARRLSLPVIIHSREAPTETIAALSHFPTVHGVIHCFSYGLYEAKMFLDRGYYISFAGNLTYKNAQNLRDTLPFIPADRLLLETDCPFLAPASKRGTACHPGMIRETYEAAAEILGIGYEELKERVAANAAALFGWM